MSLHITVFSGAGISKESGLSTFRDAGGLWEGYNPEDVATPEAWERDPELVLRFYNERRKQVRLAKPNKAHKALALLEKYFSLSVVTQNVDDLHERAGSRKVIHIHGEILKAQSSMDSSYIEHLGDRDIYIGDKCPKGFQLRPYIVWFGEPVIFFEEAIEEVKKADIFLIIGTSLNVFPANSLVNYMSSKSKTFLIDPQMPQIGFNRPVHHIAKPATQGIDDFLMQILNRDQISFITSNLL